MEQRADGWWHLPGSPRSGQPVADVLAQGERALTRAGSLPSACAPTASSIARGARPSRPSPAC